MSVAWNAYKEYYDKKPSLSVQQYNKQVSKQKRKIFLSELADTIGFVLVLLVLFYMTKS